MPNIGKHLEWLMLTNQVMLTNKTLESVNIIPIDLLKSISAHVNNVEK